MQVSKDTGIKMRGLKKRLKERDSFLRKVNKESKNSLDEFEIRDTINSTNDVIRYTYQDSALTLVDSYGTVKQALKQKGYEMVRVKNTWLDKGNPYNGINCTLKTPDGQLFEVQFHTPESYTVKDQMHKDYEAWRVLEPSSMEAINLRRKMMEQSQGMEVPINIKEVKNK